MPLFGDSSEPSALCLSPARQPTAAMTAPGFAFAVFGLSGPGTTTSVTMLARKQSLSVFGFPVQSGVGELTPAPVGRLVLTNVAPPSVERNSPSPVAA